MENLQEIEDLQEEKERQEYIEKHKLAIENVNKVLEYLKEKYPLNFDYNVFNNNICLEFYSQDYKEVRDDYEITYGIELEGQEDGKLIANILVWKDSYYPNAQGANDFGRFLFDDEIEQIYKKYQDGINFAKELKSKFEFIEIEKA